MTVWHGLGFVLPKSKLKNFLKNKSLRFSYEKGETYYTHTINEVPYNRNKF